MLFLTQDSKKEQASNGANKTNWKYIIITIILSVFVIGGTWWYSHILTKEELEEGTICQNKCGDGICDEVVCTAIGCPCPEAKENCPEDCKEVIRSIMSPDNNFTARRSEDNSLIITNVSNKKEEKFTHDSLISDSMASYLVEELTLIQKGRRIGIYPLIDLGKWSANSKYFWGFAYFSSAADPSIPEAASVFKINIENGEITTFPIPRAGKFINYINSAALDIDKERLLFEQNINEGINLYFYDLNSEKEELIVSYSKEFLDNYFDGKFWMYVSGGAPPLPVEELRQLKPTWAANDTISYFDLETGKEIIKKIE